MNKQIQKRLGQKKKVKYSYGQYNKYNDVEQWIRITEGCPHNCPFCYEPTESKVFGFPRILRNDVKIIDMNLLCKSESLEIIKELGRKRVNKRVVYYELICGIDYRFLTEGHAVALKKARFNKIRIAWDWFYKDQMKINDAIKKLIKAGYKSRDLTIFMICNWKVSHDENLKKLDLCKIWRVKVSDNYFDNQVSPNIVPEYWNAEEIKSFRKKVRKHNQLVNFGVDPKPW